MRKLTVKKYEIYGLSHNLAEYQRICHQQIIIPSLESSLSDFITNKINESDLFDEKHLNLVSERFRKGDWCYAYKVDGKIVSTIFVSSLSPYYIEVVDSKINIPVESVVLYDLYTLRNYQGAVNYKIFYASIFSDLNERGYKSAQFFIMPHNIASLLLHKRIKVKNVVLKITLLKFTFIKIKLKKQLSFDINDLIKNLIINFEK